MRSANLFFFTQPQEMFEAWNQAQQNTPFEEKVEQFFVEFQQQPVSYGSVTDTAYQDSLYWKEQHLYGSSRLGIAKPELEVTNYTPSNASTLTTNFKNYELTNHLGNILATIKDEKQQIDQNADGIVDYYEPIVITANDYYPFGMLMPNRSFSLAGSNYRFGFNTQEKDDEVYGAGNLNTAEFWEYDTRIGRRWNLDPKPQFGLSEYSTFNGNPVLYSDIEGDIVGIRVSNRAVGYTMINLYSKIDIDAGKKQVKVKVPVYQVTVFNESGKSSQFLFTRHNLRGGVKENTTFDINQGSKGGYQAVVKGRWGQKNNVLELRPLDNKNSQWVDGMKGDNPNVPREAIQFHILGASDGCLLSVGQNNLLKGSLATSPYSKSGDAQNAFMSSIMSYQKEDVKNGYKNNILVKFDRLHDNPMYKIDVNGNKDNSTWHAPLKNPIYGPAEKPN